MAEGIRHMSDKFKSEIFSRALFLEERMQTSNLKFELCEETDRDFVFWKEKAEEVFLHRLQCYDISEEHAKILCGKVSCHSGCGPEWLRLLDSFQKFLRTYRETLKKNILEISFTVKNFPLILSDCLLPFVIYAKARYSYMFPDHIFTMDGKNAVFYSLFCRLSGISKMIIMEYFESWLNLQEKGDYPFESLIYDEYKELFLKYPVWARLVMEKILEWKSFTLQWISNIEKDYKEICSCFSLCGKICNITGDAGDIHAGGKSVLILEFDSGQKLVYKPHSLACDLCINQLFQGIQKRTGIIFYTPKVLQKTTYGFSEYITALEAENIKDIKEYFFYLGNLLCVLYLTNGKDFHYENIIASKNKCFLIDTETAFQPFAYKNYTSSLKKSGMLEIDFEGKSGMFSGISGCGKNQIYYKGQPCNPSQYLDKILEGFQKFWKFVAKQKNDIFSIVSEASKGAEWRYVLRPTRNYAALLYEAQTPENMKSGIRYSACFERLYKPWLKRQETDGKIEWFNIFQSELKALMKGNIPIFYYCKDKGICDGQKLLHKEYFEMTLEESLYSVIQNMGNEKLQEQLSYIRESLNIDFA